MRMRRVSVANGMPRRHECRRANSSHFGGAEKSGRQLSARPFGRRNVEAADRAGAAWCSRRRREARPVSVGVSREDELVRRRAAGAEVSARCCIAAARFHSETVGSPPATAGMARPGRPAAFAPCRPASYAGRHLPRGDGIQRWRRLRFDAAARGREGQGWPELTSGDVHPGYPLDTIY